MTNIILNPGDVFLTENVMVLGSMIKAVERMQSTDNEAIYSHAGIIVDDDINLVHGTTLEALQHVKRQDFFKAYKNANVYISRYKDMSKIKYDRGFSKIQRYEGNLYPVHRLFLHMFNLSQHVHWDRVVCSELAARFLHESCKHDDVFYFENWFGMNPDNLHDIFKNAPEFDIVYQGKI